MQRSDFDLLQLYKAGDVPNYEQVKRKVIITLDRFMASLGETSPAIILSSYRTPAQNRAVGGTESSRHLVGDAVDIVIPMKYRKDPVLLFEFFDKAAAAGFTAAGIYYPSFSAHLDVRPAKPDGSLYSWGRIGGYGHAYIGFYDAMEYIAKDMQGKGLQTIKSTSVFTVIIISLTVLSIVVLLGQAKK